MNNDSNNNFIIDSLIDFISLIPKTSFFVIHFIIGNISLNINKSKCTFFESLFNDWNYSSQKNDSNNNYFSL